MSQLDREDLIERLQRKGLNHVCEQIFGYLDYYSLRRAELVSNVWEKAMIEGKIWKKLFFRNITSLPDWTKVNKALKGMKNETIYKLKPYSTDDCYRKACCLIESEIQLLEWNWKNIKYSEQKSEFGSYQRRSSFTNSKPYFDVSGNWVVKVQPDRRVLVLNRWTLKTEKVLEIPIMQICFDEEIPTLETVKVNDDFIVASFHRHSEICVWNAHTKELLSVLDGFPSENEVEINGGIDHGKLFTERFCLWRNLLLTCHFRLIPSDESFVIKLRKLSSSVDEEVTTVYSKVIDGSGLFWGLQMDDTYIMLPFSIHESEDISSARFLIEIRNTLTFDRVNEIKFKKASAPYDFHYSKGIVATGLPGKSIKIWSVATGLCVAKISYSDSLVAVRLIEDNFIVSCNESGKLKIWDLKAVMANGNKQRSSILPKIIPPPGHPSFDSSLSMFGTSMEADRFQIVITRQFDRKNYVYVKNFLGAAK